MTRLLKFAALFVAIACLTWIVVITRWRGNGHAVDAGDLVLWLGVLPVVLFLLALAARWAVRGALAAQAARDTAAAAAASTAAAGSGPGGAAGAGAAPQAPGVADASSTPWRLLHAGVHVAAGTDAASLLAALEAGAPRPKPDARLRDRDGLPVMSARIEALGTGPVEEALVALRDAMSPDAVDAETLPTIDASVATALAIERRVATRVVRALAALSPLLDECAPMLAQAPGTVRVLAAWPEDWDDAACALAQRWLDARLVPAQPSPGATAAPRWLLQAQRRAGAELLDAAARLLDPLQREGRADPVVLVACHSDLDDAALRRLESSQRLFHSARQPRVPMPGEGAALLVLSAATAHPATARTGDAHGAENADAHAPASLPVMALVHRAATARRAADIDAPGRVVADDTRALASRALAQAGAAPGSVASLACDADQHTARATELFAVTLDLLPDLDAADDLRLAGTLCGRLGPAAPLVAVALAAARAADSKRPALALSLADAHWRAASLLLPPT